MRPIVSSLNSITSGAESYLHDLITPIVKNCKYSLNSTIELKKRFLEIQGFNSVEYEIVSYDCVSLYTSINIDLVLEHILEIVYEKPEEFFPPKSKIITVNKTSVTKILEPPPRNELKEFFENILTKFNNFESLTGFYKQISGCSMGSKLSPSFANIFCSLFETKIVEPEINKGNILTYARYVDDIFCVIRKGEKLKLLDKLDNFDSGLEFTIESMSNFRLNFLDTSIVQYNDEIHLEQFRKLTASDCIVNYKNSVSPKSYKISALVGELYRCNNTTTTTVARDTALQNTKLIFMKNRFPEKLIDQKISDLKLKNFRPSDAKAKRQEEFDNPDFDHHTLSLPFSSARCSSIASQIYKILKNITPFFKLHIVFTTLKLASLILPRLKPKKDYFNNNDVIYQFDCECDSSYIGETKRLLHARILEHRTKKSSHVFKHISACEKYKNTLYDQFNVDPDNLPPKNKFAEMGRAFIHDHFKILETNLTNPYHRKLYEGLLITLHQPDINKQVKHQKMTFICKCMTGDDIT